MVVEETAGTVILEGLFLTGNLEKYIVQSHRWRLPAELFIQTARRFTLKGLVVSDIKKSFGPIFRVNVYRAVFDADGNSVAPYFVLETEVPELEKAIKETRDKLQQKTKKSSLPPQQDLPE